jgi:hypothetical protein
MSNNTVVRLKPSNFEGLKKIDPDINIAISMLLGKEVTDCNKPESTDEIERLFKKYSEKIKNDMETVIADAMHGRL